MSDDPSYADPPTSNDPGRTEPSTSDDPNVITPDGSDTPDTGDSSNIIPWMAALVGAAAALALILSLFFKKQKQED